MQVVFARSFALRIQQKSTRAYKLNNSQNSHNFHDKLNLSRKANKVIRSMPTRTRWRIIESSQDTSQRASIHLIHPSNPSYKYSHPRVLPAISQRHVSFVPLFFSPFFFSASRQHCQTCSLCPFVHACLDGCAELLRSWPRLIQFVWYRHRGELNDPRFKEKIIAISHQSRLFYSTGRCHL